MHQYSTDFVSRTRVVFRLAAGSVALFIGVGILLDATDVKLPFWIGIPSAGAIFFAFFWLYDTVLWRWHVSRLRLSRIPDLNGTYTGNVTIVRGTAGKTRETPCWLRISQTWSHVSIEFQTSATISFSSMAVIDKDDPILPGIRYEYHVTPRNGTIRTGEKVRRHSGLSEMAVERRKGGQVLLRGTWFNDHLHNGHGEYCVRLGDPIEASDWLATIPPQAPSQ